LADCQIKIEHSNRVSSRFIAVLGISNHVEITKKNPELVFINFKVRKLGKKVLSPLRRAWA
jgi:hypothetical protein